MADTRATTHKDHKPPKVLSHIQIHPVMGGGVRVERHHTHGMDHPPIIENFRQGESKAFHIHLSKHTGMEMQSQGAGALKSEHEIEKSEGEEG